MAERKLRGNLGNLLKRARAAGKRDERVAKLNHLGLARGHIGRNDELCEVVVLHTSVDEELRLDADHVSTGFKGAAGELAHETHLGATVYKRVSRTRNPSPELIGGGGKRRVVSFACTEIYRDVHASPHPIKNGVPGYPGTPPILT